MSRRCVLGLGAGLVSAGLAGCMGSGGPSSGPPTEAAESDISDVGFEGRFLVVRLADDHDVSRLNLIAPDGSLFGQADVEVGVTTARIELLDVKPERAGLKHYTPGVHELVTVSDAESASVDLELVPELRIVDVRQYRDGERASDFGKLVVEVENVGSGPTWVHSITYQDSPNFAANGELGGDPGTLSLEGVTDPNGSVLVPNQAKTFMGVNAPLLIPQESETSCDGFEEFTLFVESPVLPPLEESFRAELGGEIVSIGFTDEFSCTGVNIERT